MNQKERSHAELIEKIAKSIRKINKKVVIKKESEYDFRKKGKQYIGKPDIIAVIGRTLYIFEIKTEVGEKESRKILKKHIAAFSAFFGLQQIIHKIPDYSNIKAFWIPEKWNCIISLQTEESFALDPTFFENPWAFLNNN